ncbi:uncharacterized protein EV422DRAFT_563054 [Fimicolochytrium jonesii]|uniref:uncharacterized protein n=1 Tax=Fimicolochytrium jonesii TaxID=1396493 RepID=UPI0022FE32BC|nr:uncharacterized protein EV422DRAFT_563054 [Fimicolochytrium jonesii]KAI8826969.1 hypothetical protein EV422DRAFT_563054 [Fimicolochytrium jonesii]
MAEPTSPHYVAVALTPADVTALLCPRFRINVGQIPTPDPVCVACEPIPVGWNNKYFRVSVVSVPGANCGGDQTIASFTTTYILRIINEVAALRYVATAIKNRPVPTVVAYQVVDPLKLETGEFHWMLVTEMPMDNLQDAWPTLTQQQKEAVVDQLARIVCEMRKCTFDRIGGWTLTSGGDGEGTEALPAIGPYWTGPLASVPRNDSGDFPNLNQRWNRGPHATATDYYMAAFDAASACLLPVHPALHDRIITARASLVRLLGSLYQSPPRVPGKIAITALLDWEWSGAFPAPREWACGMLLLEGHEEDNTWSVRRFRERVQDAPLAEDVRTKYEAIEHALDAMELWHDDRKDGFVRKVQQKMDAIVSLAAGASEYMGNGGDGKSSATYLESFTL